MSSGSREPSISAWIDEIKQGDERATAEVWNRYYTQLVGFAAKKLRAARNRAADAEDVAASAFASFVQRAAEGRFPSLRDRDDLWRLLVTIAERKAINQIRDENRQKRGGGQVRGDSAMMAKKSASGQGGFDRIAGPEPTPEMAVQMAEVVGTLLGQLDDELQEIALRKLEGYTNAEIASNSGCAIATVERRLRLIRKKWENSSTTDSSD